MNEKDLEDAALDKLSSEKGLEDEVLDKLLSRASEQTRMGVREIPGFHLRPGLQALPELRYSAPEGVTLEKSPEDSGYDLRSTRTMQIAPGWTLVVPTGVRFEIPRGYEIQVRSRSGLARRGVLVLNSPGTVDGGYRGEVWIIIHNTGTQILDITKGDRIAQAVLCVVPNHSLTRVGSVSLDTDRGSKGFGSSGVR